MIKAIAHRGFSSRYPENTMLAFSRALALGADGAEFDVQLTKDGIPVVFHDESLTRITGDSRLIKDLTLQELQTFDLSYRFKGQCPAQRIPTLEEYFTLVQGHDFWSILEFKTAIFEYDGIERKVIDMIQRYGLRERIVPLRLTTTRCCAASNLRPIYLAGFCTNAASPSRRIIASALACNICTPTIAFWTTRSLPNTSKRASRPTRGRWTGTMRSDTCLANPTSLRS